MSGLGRLLRRVCDPPYPAALVVAQVQRAIWPLRESNRTMRRAFGAHHAARETAGENRVIAGEIVTREVEEHNLVTLLRKRRTIRRAVEGDEDAGAVRRREHRAGVEHHRHRRPVRRECDERLDHAIAAAGLLLVTAVLGSDDALLL